VSGPSEPESGIVLNAWPGFSRIGIQRWRLVVEVDGVPRKGVWRKQTFHLPPGTHSLAVSYTRRVWTGAPISPRSMDVVVGIGEMIRVRYLPGWYRDSLGRLYVEDEQRPF
jgi:hypothetical protein